MGHGRIYIVKTPEDKRLKNKAYLDANPGKYKPHVSASLGTDDETVRTRKERLVAISKEWGTNLSGLLQQIADGDLLVTAPAARKQGEKASKTRPGLVGGS
jgi:hypothetical protein